MSFRRLRPSLAFLLAVFVAFGMSQAFAQTTTTGDVSGVVTDQTGAVVPNATLTLKSLSTGSSKTATSGAQGAYRFALLAPGPYSITVSASGFQSVSRTVTVALGADNAANIQLAVSSSQETVEVTGTTASIETEDANLNTNFSAQQVSLLPNPGNDLSAVALTSPGAVMNTAGGSTFGGGNFEVYGLPATSNLFTLDGANDNDPYFNINNSGATNLSLGLNDVQESTVVTNGYSGSYGGLAGANINYVSKSGSNAFHGNAIYWWNGDVMNANNYFNNQSTPAVKRPFVNANQFAGSVGGPIKKDKAFFFFDYEGVYLAVPSPVSVNLPTAAFQNAVIGNLNATGFGASVPFYQHMFNLWDGVSQTGALQLPGGGCSNVTAVNGIAFGASNPCAVKINHATGAHTHDVFYVGRFDENLTNNDKLFVRVEHEHGLQASFIDPISSIFDAQSDQPQWLSQVSETHTFGSTKVNDFKASLLWYSAGFTSSDPAAALSPTTGIPGTIALGDGSLQALGGLNFNFPQGRNITQYQFVDDFSWVKGRHSFKVGVNYRRDDVTDFTISQLSNPLVVVGSLADFAAGGLGGGFINQNFPTQKEVPIALYQLGAYAADDIRVTSNFKMTLSLRLDHISNPVCQTNCFQRLAAPFGTMDTSLPVNQAISAGLTNAFPYVTAVVAEPKIGFTWSPFGLKNTVLRGGAGIFADSIPTNAMDNFLEAAPLVPGFLLGGTPLAPGQPGNAYSAAQAANAAFHANFNGGGPVPAFNFFNSSPVKVPRYYEWSLELQQGIGWHTTLSTMYVGNHGSNEEYANGALNAFCCAAGQLPSGATSFANLPTSQPDPRFGTVFQEANGYNSNYAGLVVSAKHSFSGGLQFQANYTWSHALDEISNNSSTPFGLNVGGQQADIIYPENPFNPRQFNYGNADYDIRHNFTMNYVWENGFRHLTNWGPNALMKGWTFSGTIFRHSGLPMTLFSSAVTNALVSTGFGSGTQYIFADQTAPSNTNCSGAAAQVNNPCFLLANFADPVSNYPEQRRNQFHGPGYFDTDFAVEKGFGIPKWEGAQFSVGARFFNLFNHPNFNYPIGNFDNPQFGQIISTVSTPTSIFGSGLGADASPRLIQLQAKFSF